jgi:hypothetical protein
VLINYRRHHNEYGIQPSSELRLVKVTPSDIRDYPRQEGDSLYGWGYFGHVSCGILLNAACNLDESRLRALNNLCRSSRSLDGLVDMGLDYGRIPVMVDQSLGQEYGIEPCLSTVLTSAEIQEPSRAHIYDANPCSLTFTLAKSSRIYDCNSGVPSFMGNERLSQALQSARNDCFIDIPEEIRLLILANLPSRDVVNAKIASAAFAYTALCEQF